MRHSRLLLWTILFLFCGISAYAQGSPQFDAATIKLLPPDQRTGHIFMRGGPGSADPGRVTVDRSGLMTLLVTAFHVDHANIIAPEWLTRSEMQYTFTATMPRDTSKHDFDLMFQKFLVEQFKIMLHREPRSFPAYDLVVSPGGPKLKASADQTDPTDPDSHYGFPATDADGFAILAPGRGSDVASGPKGMHAVFQQYSIPEFADYLLTFVTAPGDRRHYVVDKTGISGRYDIRLKFDNRDSAFKAGPDVLAALGAQDPLAPGSGLPSIFKALEQQLGLKLVKAKDIPVNALVIDHAEQLPVGN